MKRITAPFIRAKENPLVTPDMMTPWQKGFKVVCTFNAGVAQYGGEVLLLLRVAEKPPQAPAVLSMCRRLQRKTDTGT